MQFLKYISYKWKKKFGKMNQQNDALVQRYKDQYFGKMYQWVRPINNETPGEIVRVVDVKMRGDMVLLVFNAGTPLNVNLVGQYLQPYGGGDIAPVPSLGANQQNQGGGGPIEIPAELQQFTQGQQGPNKISFSSPPVQEHAQQPPPKKKSDLFALFQSVEKNINLPLRIKMPDIDLVKMMYSNAADKDKFLTELAEYIIEGISVETAKDAIRQILGAERTAAVEITNVTPVPPVEEIKKPEANGKQESAADTEK